MTKAFVVGHPIKHSASPAMQNAGISALGLNWRYVAFDVHPDNLREAIAGARSAAASMPRRPVSTHR